MKLNRWEKMYAFMRSMDVPVGDATKIANIVTKECRESPDDDAMELKAKSWIESMADAGEITLADFTDDSAKPKIKQADKPNLHSNN